MPCVVFELGKPSNAKRKASRQDTTSRGWEENLVTSAVSACGLGTWEFSLPVCWMLSLDC